MKRQRVCLVDTGGGHWLGGSYYIRNIIAALEQLPEEQRARIELLCLTEHAGPFPTGGMCTWVTVPRVGHSVAHKIVRRLLRLSGVCHPLMHLALKKVRPDFAYPCATGSRERIGYRTAHWIADFQTQKHPEFSPPSYHADSNRYVSGVMENAQRVVLSSRASEEDARVLYPQFVEKLFVMPFRAACLAAELRNDPPGVAAKYSVPEKYLIVCNQFWAHKNHLKLFEAVALLQARGVKIHLVCTGRLHDPRDLGYSDVLLQALAKFGVRASVSLLGALPRGEMLELMRHAQALIQPSLFEGWNTSVEEAHCLGIPMVVSDLPVHREQAPPGALFFDPDSATELAAALQTRWETEKASWSLEREAAALDAYQPLIRAFAERFLQLALDENASAPSA